jgi:hypothetical protein
MSAPPHNIGRYEVLGEIGRGGMAVVYRSRHFELERIDALKALHAVAGTGPDTARRFLQEARVAGGLSHPNVVTVYDYFDWRGTPYIAMELLERGSLRPYVGALTVPQIGGVLGDVLAGLAHAERRQVVHRDLKPENLLVTDEGRVKIADFGISKATSRVSTVAFHTATGMTVGTPAYMAPEQAMAQPVGPWTDLYSLGCMAYELCVGQPPFADSDEPLALLLRQVNEPIPPAHSVNPHVHPDLSGWIDTLLVKEPERRTASPAIAWETLEEILIATVGPRWRRSAALPDAPPAAGDHGWSEPPRHARSSILPSEEVVTHLARRAPVGRQAAYFDRVASPGVLDPPATVAPRQARAPQGADPPPGARRRAPLVAGGALIALILAGVVLALTTHGGSHAGDGRPPPSLAQGVRELAAILRFSARGNHLSKLGHYSDAVTNRRQVASRLAGFRPPAGLRAATKTLRDVTQLAIQFNSLRAAGRMQSAHQVDVRANELRRRFRTQFEPLARRYLGPAYHLGRF